MALTATPIPAFPIIAWLLRAADGRLAVCDPAEERSPWRRLSIMGGKLDLILQTHHHGDHVAGVPGLVARYGARWVARRRRISIACRHSIRRCHRAIRADAPGSTAAVSASDGHARGHIAFHIADSHILLCGDTLFSLGWRGRLLEGTAEQMFASLAALAALPGETLVCCGHEYTESNARFAITVEPDNAALKARIAEAHARSAPPASRRCPAPSLPNAPPILPCARQISPHLPASVPARTSFR
jgi:hydroxyacylglutathione hydrolase